MKWLCVLLLVTAVSGALENPDENVGVHDPNLFEGDMILSKEQIRRAEKGEDVDSSRKRGSSRFRLWPNGVVPYVIDPSLSGDFRAVDAIIAGMAEWTMKTCIRFKRRTINEQAFVNFTSGANQHGCSSFVGRTGSRQDINLARGCWTRGIVAHEIGHAVGFYHEQSRPDRDDYITIQLENIREGATTLLSTTQLPTTLGTITLPPTTTQLPPTTGSCQDRDSRCRNWPRFYCRFYRYVRENCRKRCRRC